MWNRSFVELQKSGYNRQGRIANTMFSEEEKQAEKLRLSKSSLTISSPESLLSFVDTENSVLHSFVASHICSYVKMRLRLSTW
jgi:hypothetical protein